MKIVHVIGYFQPELGYEEYYLAKSQAKLGHEVHVITSDRIWPFENVEQILKRIGSPYQDRMRPIGDSIVDGIRVHRLPVLYEFSDFILVRGLPKVLRNIKPNVVHGHEARQGTPVLPSLYKSLGYTYIIDHHGYSMPVGYKSYIEYMLFRKIVTEYAFKKADAILPINDYIEKFLVSTHKLEKQKIKKINTGIIAEGNGVDTDTFYFDKQSRDDIRNRFSIDRSEILLVFAGKMDNRKGLEMLIAAFAKIKIRSDCFS
jgi:glycosyltransferase involved in cell wall biosynthesis